MFTKQKVPFLFVMALGMGMRGVLAVEEIQVVNLGSTPFPVFSIPLTDVAKGSGIQSTDGKALASDRLENGILIDTPLPAFATCKLRLTGKETVPEANGPSWLKKTSTTYADQEGRLVLRLPSEQMVFMETLSMDCAGNIEEKTKGNVLWEIAVPEKSGMRCRFFGPAAGEIIIGNTTVVFHAKSPLTLMPRKEFSIPRYTKEGDSLLPGQDWMYIGPRKGPKAGGSGLYLWCLQGAAKVTADGLLVSTNTALAFQRGEFSINWYVPDAPAIMRSKAGAADRFEGRAGIYACTVLDRNKDGLADLNADLWWIRPEAAGDKAASGLLYAFQPGSTGKAEYLCLAKPPDDIKELRNLKIQGPVPVDPTNFSTIKLRDQDFVVGEPDKNSPMVQAIATLWDWNASGRIMCGSLLRGGHRSEGWHWWPVKRLQSIVIFDLDGDSVADIFYKYSETPGLDGAEGNYLYLNVQGRTAVTYGSFKIDPATATNSSVVGWTRHCMKFASIAGAYTLYGRYYNGAAMNFDEHFAYRFDQIDDLGGGYIKSPHAYLFSQNNGGNIDALTMGQFGGGPLWGGNIEVNPIMAEANQPPVFRVIECRDPGGRFFKRCSTFMPNNWDGKPLTLKMQGKWNAADYLPDAPWKQVTLGKYFKLKGVGACFTQEGDFKITDEGMWGSAQRIERNNDGVDFTLYYSPLFGGLHLKGADISCQVCPLSWPWRGVDWRGPEYRKDDLTQGVKVFGGVMPEGSRRYSGPAWFYCQDLNADGYFDTYLYDAENDGIYERGAWHDPKTDTILLSQGRRFTAWPERVKFTEVPYQIENYDKIEQLYLQGFNEDPLPVRGSITSSGIPVELRRTSKPGGIVSYEVPREVFVTAGEEWAPCAAVDAWHGDAYTGTWRDFGPDGLVRLGTIFYQNRVIPEFLKAPWSATSLGGIDVLLVTQLRRLPTAEEMESLFQWIDGGGILLLAPTVDEEIRIWFKFFGDRLDFAMGENQIVNRTSIYAYHDCGVILQKRLAAPGNRIEHYASPVEGLLTGLNYICFLGYPLDLKGKLQPLLSYKNQPIAGFAPLGKGRIVVCSADLLVNRYLVHPEFIEPDLDNDKLANCLVRWLLEPVPAFNVSWKNAAGDSRSFEVSGKGGLLTMRRIADVHRIEVDGKLISTQPHGLLEEFPVPAGVHTVNIITEKGASK